jgi:hypothetical protein
MVPPNEDIADEPEYTARLKQLLKVEKKLSPRLRAKMEIESKTLVDYVQSIKMNSTSSHVELAKKK